MHSATARVTGGNVGARLHGVEGELVPGRVVAGVRLIVDISFTHTWPEASVTMRPALPGVPHAQQRVTGGGGNVAVLQFEHNGEVGHMVAQKVPRDAHAKEVLDDAVTAFGMDRSAVTGIYSERLPCSTPGHE
jgi:hypothetical protein